MTQPVSLLRQRLFSSVLSDCLDAAGHRDQAMHARIRPLDETLVLCGRARTALYMDVYDATADENAGENPYELEIRLVDDLKADEVPVFAGGIGPLDSKGRSKVMAIDVPVEVAGENATREALARGEKLADVFRRHGIL